MDIMINEVLYEFNLDVRLGILELAETTKDLQIKHIKLILKEILRPVPTTKQLFNIKKSQFQEIMKKFGEAIVKESAESKKKLSN